MRALMPVLRTMTICGSLAVPGAAPAMPVVAQAPAEPPTKIELDEWEGVPGRVALYRRTATSQGDRLRLEDLDMLTPVSVIVQSDEPAAPVQVALHKEQLPAPVRTEATDARGLVRLDFRTYSTVDIEMKAGRPSPYLLAVWVGPPRELEVPSPFVGLAGHAAADKAATPAVRRAGLSTAAVALLVAMAGGGLLIVMVAAVWFGVVRIKKRRVQEKASVAAMVALALGTLTSSALAQVDRFDVKSLVDAGTLNPATGKLTGPKPWYMGDPDKVGDKLGKGVSGAAGWAKKAFDIYRPWKEFEALSHEDWSYEPQLAPPGMPRVPLHCADSPQCGSCLRAAYARLTDVRKKLENNRIVLAHYHKFMTHVEDAGRAVGGLGQGAGVLFLQHKAEWDAQRASVDAQYDQHYTKLMQELLEALRAIERCEAEVYGSADWYNRSGFMYYEFMATHYRR